MIMHIYTVHTTHDTQHKLSLTCVHVNGTDFALFPGVDGPGRDCCASCIFCWNSCTTTDKVHDGKVTITDTYNRRTGWTTLNTHVRFVYKFRMRIVFYTKYNIYTTHMDTQANKRNTYGTNKQYRQNQTKVRDTNYVR